jgi:hypothetical protein
MPADDSIFEKALERQMRKRPIDGVDDATQHEACPDAEWLAAYHERSLSDEEMVLWKEHIANCGRCQDVLGALETTEEISLGGEREGEFAQVTEALGGMFGSRAGVAVPRCEGKITPLVMSSTAPVRVTSAPTETASGPYRKRATRKYWVLAAGTIAAAAVLYVGVAPLKHKTPIQTAKTVETAKTEGATKPEVAEGPQLSAQNGPAKDLSTEPVQGVAPSAAERNQRIAGQAGKMESGAATADSLQTGRREDSPKKSKGLTGLAPLRGARSNNIGQGAGSGAGRAAASSPAAAAPPTQQEANADDAKTSAAAAARETVTIVNEAPPVPVGPAAQSVAVSSEKPAAAPSHKKDETAELAATVQVQSQYRANAIGGSLELSEERDAHLIPAPGGNVVWRVGAAGTIEQSTNAGATWAKQTSGVTDKMLRGGSAPSEAVCWVVGSAGTILRTVDGGGHWMAVVSPLGPGAKKGELGGVLGVDALHATVWDARNTKQFTTSDGGQSWVRVEKQQK